jgi:hypothetical protein
MNSLSRSQKWAAIWGAVALTAIGLPATAIASSLKSEGQAAHEQFTASPLLESPQEAVDRLPNVLLSKDRALPNFDPSSSRSLSADQEGIRYWLGQGADHATCLVGVLPGEEQFAAMTCAGTGALNAHGLVLQISDKVSGRGIYVPAGVDLSAVKMQMLDKQFAVGTAEELLPAMSLSRHEQDGSSTPFKLMEVAPQPAGDMQP